MDRITLTGVTAVGHHGVFDFERRDGQPFVVDAVLYLDFTEAAQSVDVRDTAHYGEVAQRITDWISGEPLNLIEALAVRIADSLLSEFPLLAVDVTVQELTLESFFPANAATAQVLRRLAGLNPG